MSSKAFDDEIFKVDCAVAHFVYTGSVIPSTGVFFGGLKAPPPPFFTS